MYALGDLSRFTRYRISREEKMKDATGNDVHYSIRK